MVSYNYLESMRRKGAEKSKMIENITSITIKKSVDNIKVWEIENTRGREGSETDNFMIKLWVHFGDISGWVNVLP